MTDTITSAEGQSTNTQAQQLDGFHGLVQDLSRYIHTARSSSFSEICDPKAVMQRMENYCSDRSEWLRYAHQDGDQCFTRNMVERGFGRCNILILVWTPLKQSPVHDHSGSHCIMKILKGNLQETKYKWPERKGPEEYAALEIKDSTLLSQDEVTYISDNHGLHKILNPDPEEYAVSLHLYAPPNAAKEGCQVFDEKTGKATRVVQYDLYSEMGQRKGRSPEARAETV